ncbi:MAG: GNAT family N-acetyltransferase [Lachnospiraceae bacterium]|nr:GNAT family N-acetyltransferase [Lachnospiraceae bacterium]
MEEYRKTDKNDIDDIMRNYSEYLNSGEYIDGLIRQASDDGMVIGNKVLVDGKTAGYLTFQKRILFTYPHPREYDEVMKVLDGRNAYTIDSLMIFPEYRKRGIARRLVQKGREDLLESGIDLVMVEIWMLPDGTMPARKIYEEMGETIYSKTVKDFYRDLHKYGIKCPVCGTKCRCGAMINLMDISK